MTDKKLDAGITLQGQPMTAAVDDPEHTEVLGYGVMYTVGSDWNVMVDREWLLDRCQDLGIPQWVAPNEPRPSSAYKRAIKSMKEHYLNEYSITAPRLDTGVEEPHTVTVQIKEGDGRYVRHVYGEVFFDEEESKQDGGTWDTHHLGYLTYDSDSQSLIARREDDLDPGDHLMEVWSDVVEAAKTQMKEMKTTHIGHDIRKMMYYSTRDYTSKVIPLRDGGAVYFFPSELMDFVDSMAQLYEEIDQKFKEGGKKMAVRKFPIFDSDADWVRERMESVIDESVDKALEDAFEQLAEGETVDAVARAVMNSLGEDVDTAAQYNALLEAEIEVEEVLEERKESLQGDKEDLIEEVLNQTDFDDI